MGRKGGYPVESMVHAIRSPLRERGLKERSPRSPLTARQTGFLERGRASAKKKRTARLQEGVHALQRDGFGAGFVQR